MSSFYFIWFQVILFSGGLSSEDFCNENGGHFQILEAVRWNDVLFVMLDNFEAYRIYPFKWDGINFTVGHIKRAPNWNRTYTELTKLIFTVDYPDSGKRIIFMSWQNIEEDFVAKIVEFDERMTEMISSEDLVLNRNECHEKDVLRLCTLFTIFSEDNIWNQLLTISSFPSDPRFSPRIFVYSKEEGEKECSNCFVTKRSLFVKQSNSDVSQDFWKADNATNACCAQLKGIIVGASTALVDYYQEVDGYYFDLIEFYGNDYNVIRIPLTNDFNVSDDMKIVKTGSFRALFNCTVITTTTESEKDGYSTVKPEVQTTKESEITPKPKSGFSVVLALVFFAVVLAIIGGIVWFIVSKKKAEFESQPHLKSNSNKISESAPVDKSKTGSPSTEAKGSSQPTSPSFKLITQAKPSSISTTQSKPEIESSSRAPPSENAQPGQSNLKASASGLEPQKPPTAPASGVSNDTKSVSLSKPSSSSLSKPGGQ